MKAVDALRMLSQGERPKDAILPPVGWTDQEPKLMARKPL